MKCYITNIPHCDGLGARFQRMLYLMYFSYYIREKYDKEVEFLYLPFSFEGFGRNFYDRDVTNFYFSTKESYRCRAEMWDKKFNYTGKKITDIDLSTVKIVDRPSFQDIINQIENDNYDNKLYLFDQMCYQFDDNTISDDLIYRYQEEILSKFNMINPFNKDKINISIHIRRDDVDKNFTLRWLSDEYYLQIIDIIENNLENYSLKIHTQKQNFNFDKFKKYEVLYDEIYEDYDSFTEFIFSDILILGKSSFGYAPALLKKELVVYHDFWHKKLDFWIKIDELESKLKELNQKNK